ncbi:MAG: transcriptional regulator [Candidatus Aenigmatarchaeota archaeon]
MSLKESLRKLEERVSKIENLVYDLKNRLEILETSSSLRLTLALPDHLLKTFITVYELGIATASQVAERTKKARAVESAYLNQLTTMGYLKKERKERNRTYFQVDYNSPLSKHFLKTLERK